MRRIIMSICLGGSILASMVCVLLLSTTEHLDVGLVCVKPLKDLGDVGQGLILNEQFEVKNSSPTTITIHNMLKDCDCASVKISKNSLLPGEKATVEVVWETRSKRGINSTNVIIVGYDQQREFVQLPLRLRANVIADYSCEPSNLSFDVVEEATQVLTLQPGRLADVKFLKVVSPGKMFKSRIVSDHAIEVRYEPGEHPDLNLSRNLSLKILTNSVAEPTYFVGLATSAGGREAERRSLRVGSDHTVSS